MQTWSKASVVLVLLSTFFLAAATAFAQEDTPLDLRLSRNFGFSSGTGKIQGTFTIRVAGPDDLARVVFFIDGDVMGEANEAPFELKFHTGDYPLGVHTLNAVGYTLDGSELYSNQQKREFVSAEVGWRTAGSIVLPLLGIIVIVMVISIAAPSLVGRGKKKSLPLGEQRSYGIFGGTICPKCDRPFGMHIWGLNMMVGKFDRCPHCGKWSLVRRATLAALQQAEAAELETESQFERETSSPEERLLKDLEDSRYQDM